MADVCACSTAGVIGPVNGQFQGCTNFIHTGQLNLAFDWFNGVCVLVVHVLGWDKFA